MIWAQWSDRLYPLMYRPSLKRDKQKGFNSAVPWLKASDDAQLRYNNLGILPRPCIRDNRKSSSIPIAVRVTVLIAADMFKRTAELQRNARPPSMWGRSREAIIAEREDCEKIRELSKEMITLAIVRYKMILKCLLNLNQLGFVECTGFGFDFRSEGDLDDSMLKSCGFCKLDC